jgi:hypothetical protein
MFSPAGAVSGWTVRRTAARSNRAISFFQERGGPRFARYVRRANRLPIRRYAATRSKGYHFVNPEDGTPETLLEVSDAAFKRGEALCRCGECSIPAQLHSIPSDQAARTSSTAFLTSQANRRGFCSAIRAINSDLVMSPQKGCGAEP